MAINKLMNYATKKKLMQDTFLAECVNDHENEDQTKIGQETNVLKQIKTDSKSWSESWYTKVNIYMASFFFLENCKWPIKPQKMLIWPITSKRKKKKIKKKKLLCLNKKNAKSPTLQISNINFAVYCCAKILLAIILLWFVRSWSIFAISLLITRTDLVKRLWTYNKIINITFIWIVNHEKSNYKFRLYQEKKYK